MRKLGMMKLYRFAQFATSGAFLLGASGCTFTEANEFLQTILLAITAAGGIVIIQNI